MVRCRGAASELVRACECGAAPSPAVGTRGAQRVELQRPEAKTDSPLLLSHAAPARLAALYASRVWLAANLKLPANAAISAGA